MPERPVESGVPRFKRLSRNRYRKYFTTSSVAMYSGVFLLIVSLVAVGYQPPERMNASASAVNTKTATNTPTNTLSVEDVVAANVAASIAETTNLPIASNVANLSQSLRTESVLTENESNIVTKPQIVELSADSRQMQTYTAKAGDTVGKIADRFGISAATVRWANDLSSDAVSAGKKLKILPVDGVVYTVKSGDSIDSIAKRYNANKTQLISFNDLEISGLQQGKQIIVPNGVLPQTERPGYVAPQTNSTNATNSGGYGSANPYLAGASVGNRYAWGNCTWYAYERRAELGRPVGSFWGNASTWSVYAQAAGFTVNGTPAPGAVMEGGGGSWYGHVAIVESVDPGKSITISEMNGYRFGGGFNRVGRGTIPWSDATSGFYRYIH